MFLDAYHTVQVRRATRRSLNKRTTSEDEVGIQKICPQAPQDTDVNRKVDASYLQRIENYFYSRTMCSETLVSPDYLRGFDRKKGLAAKCFLLMTAMYFVALIPVSLGN